MMHRCGKTLRLVAFICLPLIPLATGGCGDSLGEALPSDAEARQALDAALTAWREGKKPGPIEGTKPTAEIHDSRWSLGDRLSSYEILGESRDGGVMKFSARLKLAEPDRAEDVEYYVLGRDPLLILRDQDYVRDINMNEGPKQAGSGKARGRRPR